MNFTKSNTKHRGNPNIIQKVKYQSDTNKSDTNKSDTNKSDTNKSDTNKSDTNKYGINDKNKKLPFVSVCTPTFNRRPFIPYLLECFKQDYPKDRMEWIIVDDADDQIADLLVNVPCVRYFRSKNKLGLGKKKYDE